MSGDYAAEKARSLILKKQLRHIITEKQPYVAQSMLKAAEQDGFHATSAILWRHNSKKNCVEFFMAYERRRGKLGFNFFGGKRDDIEEKIHTTLCREINEETAGLLILEPGFFTGPVLWDPGTQQGVFVQELAYADEDIVQAIQDLGHPPEVARGMFEQHSVCPPDCVVTAVWMSTSALSGARHLVPEYAWTWIELLIDACRSGSIDGAREVTLDERLSLQLGRIAAVDTSNQAVGKAPAVPSGQGQQSNYNSGGKGKDKGGAKGKGDAKDKGKGGAKGKGAQDKGKGGAKDKDTDQGGAKGKGGTKSRGSAKGGGRGSN